MRSVDEVIGSLYSPKVTPSPAPVYKGVSPRGIALAVESMRQHTTDEGWQIMDGLARAGYILCGRRLTVDEVDVPTILERTDPGVVFVQDKREWHFPSTDFRDPTATFERFEVLKEREDIFKLTILKDSQQRHEWHKESADEIGCHAWVIYYHPRIVLHLAPYLRPQHVIRTYHSLDPNLVPEYDPAGRRGTFLSGALGQCYPLREHLWKIHNRLPLVKCYRHPGYHRNSCATPEYLRQLSHFKVAICTSSIYGYALRKIIEATACGCIVVTDLPVDEVLPAIDGNLVRISSDRIGATHMANILMSLYKDYDPERQEHYAKLAKTWYDFREVGLRLAAAIERMRSTYNANNL